MDCHVFPNKNQVREKKGRREEERRERGKGKDGGWVAPEVKVLAARFEDLSSVPRALGERREPTPTGCVPCHVCTPTHPQSQINKRNNII